MCVYYKEFVKYLEFFSDFYFNLYLREVGKLSHIFV